MKVSVTAVPIGCLAVPQNREGEEEGGDGRRRCDGGGGGGSGRRGANPRSPPALPSAVPGASVWVAPLVAAAAVFAVSALTVLSTNTRVPWGAPHPNCGWSSPHDGHHFPVGSSPGIVRLAVSLFRKHHILRAMTFQVGHILLPTDSRGHRLAGHARRVLPLSATLCKNGLLP